MHHDARQADAYGESAERSTSLMVGEASADDSVCLSLASPEVASPELLGAGLRRGPRSLPGVSHVCHLRHAGQRMAASEIHAKIYIGDDIPLSGTRNAVNKGCVDLTDPI